MEPEWTASFGTWLRRWRQALDLTRKDLAKRVGCSQATIRAIENDDRRPSAALASGLAVALGAPAAAQTRIVACAREFVTPAHLPLPSLAVAMAAPLPVPGNLPVPPTPLVGRKSDLDALVQRIERKTTRLVTLTGLMGSGKTRLALAAAEAVRPLFAHGVWFVDLAAVADPALVAPTIARALGIADHGSPPLEARLPAALRDQTTLLVLDGVEATLPVSRLVGSLLAAAPRLTVLVTSHVPLGAASELVVPVPPLATPPTDRPLPLTQLADVPAVALFLQRAQAVNHDIALTEDTAPAITAISARLGGLPLAIELAAPLLGLLSLGELADVLQSDADPILAEALPPPERHRSLQAALEGSWVSLPEDRRRALARLAVFPTGCDREAAEAVAGAGLDDLTALAAAGLLRQERDGRLVLHDLVRRVAARRLAENGEEMPVARRHAEHYLQLAEAAGRELESAGRGPSLTRLAAEQANLRAALAWGLAYEPPLALRLAAALPWYWYFAGELSEGQTWLGRALTAAPAGDALASARAQAGAGGLAWAQGEHAAARDRLAKAVDALRPLNDGRTLAQALALLALTAHDQGDHPAAVAWATEAVAAGRGAQHPWSLALALTAVGAARFGAGDLPGADEALREGEALWSDIGDAWGIALAMLNLGRVAHAKGENVAAAIYLEDGLVRLGVAGDQRFSAAALLLLGEIALRQGDVRPAIERFGASAVAYQELDTSWGVALCLEGLAMALGAAGQPSRAARLLGAAAAVRASGVTNRSTGQAAAVQRLVDGLQEALGVEPYRAHWTAGRALPERAIAEALAEAPAAEADRTVRDAGAHCPSDYGLGGTAAEMSSEA
jgi:predicted ATPase/DNA-binding XRE family transcriptional regulator